MNNLDNIGQTFQWAGQRYMAIMQPFAEKIFLGLVLIEIIITCMHFLADQDEPTRLLAELVKKSLALGFLYAMIVNAPIWFSAIIQGFQQIGGQAAGIPALSPSTTFDSGLALFQIIYRGFASLGWFHVTLAALIAPDRRVDHVPIVRSHRRTNAAGSLRGIRRGWRRRAPSWVQRISVDDQVCRRVLRLDRRSSEQNLLPVSDGRHWADYYCRMERGSDGLDSRVTQRFR